MPILRNPFRKEHTLDENVRPLSQNKADPSAGFQRVEVHGAKPVKPVNAKPIEPTEYQLSEINDGVYVPPDPPEKIKRGWTSRTNTSTSGTSSHRSAVNENEPFNISRESFDSYRRSFDISARSPVIDAETRPRQSLDARSARLPPALRRDSAMKFNPPETQPEDRFEDVGLDDAINKPKAKKGFFSRFSDAPVETNGTTAPIEGNRPAGSHYTPSFFNRKRGQSGQGAELGNMPVKAVTVPAATVAEEVKVDT